MQQHSISVQRTAHFSTYGELSEQTRYVILACHGYGQLAKHFIRKFDILDQKDTFVIAPEGLSRFYWGGLSGDVVASWMTKEDRLEEIADYCAFLDTLYAKYLVQLPKETKIILFGFSQGVATIMRWAIHSLPKCDGFVCWAGMIPEDIDYTPHLDYFQNKKLHVFYGDNDPLITAEHLPFLRKVIEDSQLPNIVEHNYSGKHSVERSVLKDWFEEHIR
jgi:predicted esterase